MQELIKPSHIRCQVVLSFLTLLHYKQINGIILCRFGRYECRGDLIANLSNVLISSLGDPSVFAFIRSRLEWWGIQSRIGHQRLGRMKSFNISNLSYEPGSDLRPYTFHTYDSIIFRKSTCKFVHLC